MTTTYTDQYRNQIESSELIDTQHSKEAIQDLTKGLGTEVNASMTIDEQLSASNLDFTIETSNIRWGSGYKKVSSQFQAVFTSNDELLTVSSNNWAESLIQPRKIVETFNEFCSENGLTLEQIGAIRRTNEQETALGKESVTNLEIFGLADMSKKVSLERNAPTVAKLILGSPYVYGQGYSIQLLINEVVCTNGISLPVTTANRIIGHLNTNTQRLKDIMGEAVETWETFDKQKEVMTQVGLSETEALLSLVAQFGKNKVVAVQLLTQYQKGNIQEQAVKQALWSEIEKNEGIEKESRIVRECYKMFCDHTFIGSDELSKYNTVWGLLNCVTEYTTHRNQNKDSNVALHSLWNGTKANQTQAFLQTVSALANVKHYGRQTEQVSQAVRAW